MSGPPRCTTFGSAHAPFSVRSWYDRAIFVAVNQGHWTFCFCPGGPTQRRSAPGERANEFLTEELALWITTVDAQSITEQVSKRAKHLLLDSLASALAGITSPEASTVDATIRNAMGTGTSTIIGGPSASAAAAAAINGYLITARSLCDVHRPTLCHVTPVVVPPALATAERLQVDGATFLSGLVAGLETTVRLGYALRYEEFRRRGWHTPGVAGPLGGAAAATRIAGLSPDETASALGIAGSQAGGTFASFGTPTIKFHQARAALSGLLAADLAAHGFSGSREILTAEDGGLLNTFSDGGDPTALTENMGEVWRLLEISTRLWPVAAALQSVVASVLKLRAEAPDGVSSIRVGLPPASYEMNADMTWEDTFHATLSARWVTAVTLADGVCWLGQLSPDRLTDGRISDYAADHIQVWLDPELPEGGCDVAFKTTDGRNLHDRRLIARGDPDDPATHSDLEMKFASAANRTIDESVVGRVIDLVGNLEHLENVRELTTLLALQRET